MEKLLDELSLDELIAMLPNNILFRDAEVTHWCLVLSTTNCAVVGLKEVDEELSEEVWYWDEKHPEDRLLRKEGKTPCAAVKNMLLLLRQENIIQF